MCLMQDNHCHPASYKVHRFSGGGGLGDPQQQKIDIGLTFSPLLVSARTSIGPNHQGSRKSQRCDYASVDIYPAQLSPLVFRTLAFLFPLTTASSIQGQPFSHKRSAPNRPHFRPRGGGGLLIAAPRRCHHDWQCNQGRRCQFYR